MMKRASVRPSNAPARLAFGPETHSHRPTTSYRHGTVTLFAAFDDLSGKVFAHTVPRHRHQEWLTFLRKIDQEIASEFELHIICYNYATHKHAKVTAWLKRHPRFHIHFIPTSSSWLNLMERFFGAITAKVIRAGQLSQRRGLGRRHLPLSRSSHLNPNPTAGPRTPTASLKNLDNAWEALLEGTYNPMYGTSH
jgi:transposase